ncbi:hypothetical protein PPL_12170 [Heterostelium album PN500]|uniref:Uncharacterized protein n=1 Tax=Heterostelium pallidum (strain ATCC 26659 / Pp 5 / PN500) TaxID=670386 RepID=D3BLW6_HETP5|nr:hypothetical protein PPL_12170 [Heterostelium album PN500]EFA77567.1 hypothetical protein PPL_12170 [Heterostelium album PN500]|eukprot:XP_020429695.1 hypothetical protein PPL_12170 [Heterostelium album PN500]
MTSPFDLFVGVSVENSGGSGDTVNGNNTTNLSIENSGGSGSGDSLSSSSPPSLPLPTFYDDKQQQQQQPTQLQNSGNSTQSNVFQALDESDMQYLLNSATSPSSDNNNNINNNNNNINNSNNNNNSNNKNETLSSSSSSVSASPFISFIEQQQQSMGSLTDQFTNSPSPPQPTIPSPTLPSLDDCSTTTTTTTTTTNATTTSTLNDSEIDQLNNNIAMGLNENSLSVETHHAIVSGGNLSNSDALKASPYIFHCTPTYYAAKKNQKIGIFMYHRDEANRVCQNHPPLRLKLESVAPHWVPSSFTRKDNRKNIEEIAPNQFETLESTMKKGEVLFGSIRIQKTGFYYLRCSVILPPAPNDEELKFKDFHFTIRIYFYGSPSKKKLASQSKQDGQLPATASSATTDINQTTTTSSSSNQQDANEASDSTKTTKKSINIRPNENLLNYISHLQETGAKWVELDNVFDLYLRKYEKNPEILSDLMIEQSIGSTFIGELSTAHKQMDKGLDVFYSPENLFKVSYLKSAIYRIQKNYTASKLHLDTCDFLSSKIDLTSLQRAQYYFNKAAHDYDCLILQKTKQNNYTQVREQIVEKLKLAADHYAKDYESISPNSTTNARSINGTYRSNIRIAQTLLCSESPSQSDLERAETFLSK